MIILPSYLLTVIVVIAVNYLTTQIYELSRAYVVAQRSSGVTGAGAVHYVSDQI